MSVLQQGPGAADVVQAASHKLVAIIGPPNSGKSTLFNRLTGLRQKVANFPGVTVEHRVGKAHMAGHHEVDLVDLPGVYSMNPRSEDERVSHDVLQGRMEGLEKPDAILLVLDSTNLNRHLSLAAPILSLGLPTLILLNMADDLKSRGGKVNVDLLAAQLGAPVALISATRGEGLDAVRRFLTGGIGVPRPVELPVLQDVPACRQWARQMASDAKYAKPAPPVWTRRLDGLFLHPVVGPAVFVLVVLLVFQSIFAGARPMMDGIETLVSMTGGAIGGWLGDGWLKSLVVDGIW
ncbi:MAG: 50S ribosome-binding GTPase, partial [Bryobacteraceae bacterium]|nr:50S ribosome-binding GTPase [Bryobacteraceae bacterium]